MDKTKIVTSIKISRDAHRTLKIMAVRNDTSVSGLLEKIAAQSVDVDATLK